ncbi:hypothetical protein ACC713_38500, partial [Rhizobium johnstonii]|uniref:hypothetical protein n=1 Tax=Rhizobium johnstonii TaxID=3019933 RepID=UPI003F9629EC
MGATSKRRFDQEKIHRPFQAHAPQFFRITDRPSDIRAIELPYRQKAFRVNCHHSADADGRGSA